MSEDSRENACEEAQAALRALEEFQAARQGDTSIEARLTALELECPALLATMVVLRLDLMRLSVGNPNDEGDWWKTGRPSE